MKKTKFKHLAIILITIVLLFTAAFSAFATFDGWNGSSSTGSGTGHTASTNAKYSVATDTLDACGYRFYIVDINNEIYSTYGESGILDIYKTSARQGQAKLFPKRGKVQWVKEYKSNTWKKTSVSTSKANSILSKNLGSTVDLATVKPAEIESWQNKKGNLNPLLAKLMNSSEEITTSNLPAGARLVVEPIFSLRIEGTDCSLTATEIAVYGALTFKKTSTGQEGKYQAGYWAYISDYTNRLYANSIYTDTNDGLNGMWDKVPGINSSAKSTSKTSSFSDSKGCYTFDAIITKGYGVGIAYNNEPPIKIRYNTANASVAIGNSTYSKNSDKNITKSGNVYYSIVTSGGKLKLTSPSTFKASLTGYTLSTKYLFNYESSKTYDGKEHTYKYYAQIASDNNVNASSDGSFVIQADMQWTPITYTVKYYLDGVEQTSLKQTCTYGKTYTYKTVPTKTGYTVDGWYTGSSSSSKGTLCSGSFSNLTSTNGTTINRYAYSTKNPTSPTYTIAYNSNGGTGTMKSHTTKNTATIKANEFTRTGYVFKGWAVKRSDGRWYDKNNGWGSSSSNPMIYNSGEEKNFSSAAWRYINGKTGNTYGTNLTFTFYAQWEEISVQIYYETKTTGATVGSAYKVIDVESN